ncbi:non-ribosomal peptide synthetase component F [Bradyrhizobium sp. USDA 4501]
MTQHLHNLLCAVMADAQQPVGRIGLLSSDQRTYLLGELNRTAAPYPSDRCIHELFEAQVRKTPDAVAVVHADARHKIWRAQYSSERARVSSDRAWGEAG